MKNEYGAPLDRNGYAPSVVPACEGCYICGCGGDLARHEIFGGNGRREKSKQLGLWVRLCPDCHTLVHTEKVYSLALKRRGETAALAAYGWSTEDFIREFGRNYLDEIEGD